MLVLPLPFLLSWVFGLLSVSVFGASSYVLWTWYAGRTVATAWIIAAIAGTLWTLAGRFLVLAFYPRGENEPHSIRRGKRTTLRMRDGTEIYTESEGPADAPLLIMTHGWGLDSTAWYYLRQYLSSRFRVLMWDLPGLGRSSRPAGNDFHVERLAIYLREVIASVKNEPAILVGHSIGGMIMLSLCRRFPDVMARLVRGVVLIDTTYTQPLNTTVASGLFKLLRKPIIEPLLHLTVWLWPLMWFWNLLGYLNGTSHLGSRVTSFSRGVTRGQLDFGAWFIVKNNPGVLARGLLALMGWDETATLATISLPTQILVGEADRLTLPIASERMKQDVPNASLAKIARAGHAGVLEQGGRYSEAIAAWAATHLGQPQITEQVRGYPVQADASAETSAPLDKGPVNTVDQRPTIH